MKINSELPICLLNQNIDINEYDFVLFHLFESCSEYRDYYMKLRESHPERLMILDNSAYEYFIQHKSLDMDKFTMSIKNLQPDMYILPDVLMDKDATITGTKIFLDKYSNMIIDEYSKTKPLAVVQGNTEDELMDCAKIYNDLGIDNIAIPFHNSFFKDMDVRKVVRDRFAEIFKIDEFSIDVKYSMGRVEFMLKNGQYLKQKFKHIHMLGSHHPVEKVFYNDFDTMDTGYPVKCGYVGKTIYGQDKPDVIIDDFFYEDLSSGVKDLIIQNILDFRA